MLLWDPPFFAWYQVYAQVEAQRIENLHDHLPEDHKLFNVKPVPYQDPISKAVTRL